MHQILKCFVCAKVFLDKSEPQMLGDFLKNSSKRKEAWTVSLNFSADWHKSLWGFLRQENWRHCRWPEIFSTHMIKASQSMRDGNKFPRDFGIQERVFVCFSRAFLIQCSTSFHFTFWLIWGKSILFELEHIAQKILTSTIEALTFHFVIL